jgi:hypothetical protein
MKVRISAPERVEAAGGLVGEDDLRLAEERTDRAALLTTGELAGRCVRRSPRRTVFTIVSSQADGLGAGERHREGHVSER